ncbi:ATP-binding protein [Thermodesulfobacteriota bacterium]
MGKDSKEEINDRELHTILKFSALINSSLNIEDVLNSAMKWAEEFINAEASTIYELDKETNEIFIRIARGEKKAPVKRIRLKLGEGIAGNVVLNGEPIVVHDVCKDKRFSDKYDRLTGFKTSSLICVPLTLRGISIGAIQVLNKKQQKPFTEEDLELLTAMAQQIVVAMENAKLFGRLEEKFELTEKELKTTQNRLIRSERLAAIGHLVNGVAHEIRNPIMTIGGFTNRIKDSIDEDSKLRKYTDIILSETARLERLVQQVREFSEVQSATLSPDSIPSVIETAIKTFSPLAETLNVNILTSIEDQLPLMNIDSSQLVIALSNLIENALEAMHEGGKINIEVKQIDNNLLISLKDTGSGIDPQELDSVYDPFFTSKTSGAGLGLTMVHQIINNHNGEIKIESQPSAGTIVEIRLPVNLNNNKEH